MLEILFLVCLVIVFGKLFIIAMQATWGLTKILFSIVLLPLTLLGLVFGGLIYIAFPLLILIGICSLVVA